MISRLVVMLFLLGGTCLMAGETNLTGRFPGAEGREIRLMLSGDNFTFRPLEVGAVIIDAESNFSFSLFLDGPQKIELIIDHNRSSFYAEPGMSYHVDYKPFDFDAPQRKDVFWLQEDFEFELSTTKGEDILNPAMARLSELTQEFLLSQSHLVRASYSSALRAYSNKTDSIFRGISHPFFKTYYKYHLAELHHALGSKRPGQIIEEYLKDQPIHYNNSNYMYLLSRVFYTYIQGGNSKVTQYDLKVGVNQQKDYDALMKIMERDPVFGDEQLRELILLFELSKMYDNRDFHPDNVTRILKQLEQKTRTEEHRTISRNIVWNHTRMHVGHPAPRLELKDHKGEKYTLEDFKGKYLVLFFITTWCQSCMGDLGPVAGMATELADDVVFAGVFADRNPQDARALAAENSFPFQLYYFEHDYRLLERFRVNEVPVYMVIDPDGNLALYPLPSPGAGASPALKQLLMRR